MEVRANPVASVFKSNPAGFRRTAKNDPHTRSPAEARDRVFAVLGYYLVQKDGISIFEINL